MRIALAQGVSPQLAYATSCAGWQAKGTYKPNAAQAQAVYEAELEWLDARAKAGLNGWTDPRKSRKLPSPRGSAETGTEPGWILPVKPSHSHRRNRTCRSRRRSSRSQTPT